MNSDQIEALAPLAAPLPDPPVGEAFTPEQWTILLAIMDAVIPSVRRETDAGDKISQYTITDVEYNKTVDHLKRTVVDTPDSQSLEEYFLERPSENPRFQDLLKRTLVVYSREDVRKGLAFVLSALK
jgi:3-methyladenine DNA glycosylase AlkD